jgi:hypothetical protein
MSNEADARIIIDRLLREANWDIEDNAALAAGRQRMLFEMATGSVPGTMTFSSKCTRAAATHRT